MLAVQAILTLTFTPCSFCGRSYMCPFSDSFFPSFPKATCIYFTHNDQNQTDDALTPLSDTCRPKLLVEPL